MLNPPRHIARLFEAVGRALWLHKWKLTVGCTMLVAMWMTWTASVWECGGGKKKEAGLEASQLSQMVESYYLQSDPHRLPDQLDDLNDMHLVKGGEIPKDPWGTPYMYLTFDERDFRIVSAGPDGRFGTRDDITGNFPNHRKAERGTSENTRRLRL